MNLYEAVKAAVTTRTAAECYGIEVGLLTDCPLNYLKEKIRTQKTQPTALQKIGNTTIPQPDKTSGGE